MVPPQSLRKPAALRRPALGAHVIRAAAALCISWSAVAQEEVWISPTGGNWSLGSNWLDGTAPPAAGDPSLLLRFSALSGLTSTSTDDLDASFALNQLIFDQDPGRTLTLAPAAGRSLTLTGASPVISQIGSGAINLNTPLVLSPTDDRVTIANTGQRDLTIFGAISGLGATKTLHITGSDTSMNGPATFLSGSNTLSGTVALDSGNLVLRSASLGTSTLEINGGSLRIDANSSAVSNNVVLNSDLIVADWGVSAANASLTGMLTGATANAGLTLRAALTTLRLTNTATYTGKTTVDFGVRSATPYINAGTLLVTGNGSILNTSGYDIRAGGTLNVTPSSTGATDRLSDTAPLTLRGGQLRLQLSSTSNRETVGPIAASGFSTIAVSYLGTPGLDAASLTRLQRGTVFFRSTASTSSTAKPIAFQSAPTGLVGAVGGTGANVPILPYAIGDNLLDGSDAGLVTYSATSGIRVINPMTEYVSSFAGAAPTNNVRLASGALTGDTTVNALVIAGFNAGVSGTGTLTLSSGALVGNTTFANVRVPVNFGSAEGQIFAQKDFTISGSLSGSNGLTKSGAGTLTLSAAANPISGPLTINSGAIQFTNLAQLGTDTTTIVVSSGGLRYNGGNSISLTRPIESLSGFALLESGNAAGVLNVDAPISGAGGLRIGATGTGTVRLNAANTYEGPTVVSSGTLEFANDAALGAGEVYLNTGSKLRLLAPWTTTRGIRGNGGALDTNGFDAEWDGEVTAATGLSKLGAGTLSLTAASPFSGAITVSGGTLALRGSGQLQTTSVTVTNDAELYFDESGNDSARMPFNTQVVLGGGRFRIDNLNSPGAVAEIGRLEVTGGLLGSVVQLSSGSRSTTLRVDNLRRGTGELLIRANALGGANNAPFTRLTFATVPNAIDGLLTGIYATANAGAGGENLTTYISTSDSLGVVGLRPLNTGDYTTTQVLQNPATPLMANVLLQGNMTAAGAMNAVRSLTFDPGSTLSQGASQTLQVSSGQVLVRSGGAATSFTGGTVEFGSQPGTIANFGDFTLNSVVAGNAGWTKLGAGTLSLGTQPAGAAILTIGTGKVQLLAPAALADQVAQIAGTGAILDLGGTDSTVGGLNGTGTVLLGGATLTFGSVGTSFALNATFPESGKIQVVDGGNPEATRGLTLTSVPGGATVSLLSGRLAYTDRNVANPSTLTVAGGALELGSFSNTFRVPVVFTGEARVRGEATITSPGAFSGPGTVIFDTDAHPTLQIADTRTGETVVTEGSGYLRLSGTDGALAATSAVRLERGQLIVTYGSRAYGRLNDSAPIYLHGGSLFATGPANLTTVENTGAVYIGSESVLDLAPETSSSTTSVLDFRPAQFIRENSGILHVYDRALANSAPQHVEIHSTIAPAQVGGSAASGPDTSIVPGMYSSLTSQNFALSFLTYDNTRGLRSLDPATDFAQGISAVAAPTNNLRLTSAETLNANLTVNSVLFAGTPTQQALSGSGTLSVTSGAILSDYLALSNISVNLAFGSSEGLLMANLGQINVSGAISGSGGLTVTGSQATVLSATNTFTGALRVVGGNLRFTKLDALGPGNGPIEINNGALGFTGSTPATLSRPLVIGPESTTIYNGSNDVLLTIASPISGSDLVTLSGGQLLVTGANTYTGDTIIAASGVSFTSDAAFGTGALHLSFGTTQPTFNWTTSRDIYLENGTFSTGSFDAIWNGRTLGQSRLTKDGSGSLTIRDADEYFGPIAVNEGTLAIESSLPAVTGFSGRIDVARSATLSGTGIWGRDISSAGTVAPMGTLSVENANLSNLLTLEIRSPASFDQLIVRSLLTLDGDVELNLTLDYNPADNIDQFVIVADGGISPISGLESHLFRFAGNELAEGETFLVGTQYLQISYQGSDGNDIVLYAVPEPAIFPLLVSALVSFFARRRRPAGSANGIGGS